MLIAVCDNARGSEACDVKGKKFVHLNEDSHLDWEKTSFLECRDGSAYGPERSVMHQTKSRVGEGNQRGGRTLQVASVLKMSEYKLESCKSHSQSAIYSQVCKNIAISAQHTMAKKGRLLAALDAHKGRDYKLEKQKNQQKQAAKKNRSRASGSIIQEKETVEAHVNGTASMPEDESDGWESDESEAAEASAVRRALTTLDLGMTLTSL